MKSWKQKQLEKQKFRCHYCGTLLDTKRHIGEIYDQPPQNLATVDHVHPKFLGGTNRKHNKVICCLSCNQKKGAKTLLEFNSIRVELN